MKITSLAHSNVGPAPLRLRRLAPALVGLLVWLTAATSQAAPPRTSQRVASYPYAQVMPAAVRFLRVDEKHKVIEKDYKAGYILFELKEGRRAFRGALELIPTRDGAGRAAVKLVMHIEDRPRYVSEVKLDHLLRKLRKQLGVPVAPPPRARPKQAQAASKPAAPAPRE